MITENLSTLKIHNLTKEQYERELAAGRIDENALYLTPYEEQVQPDWNQNDESASDYIKNRTHWVEKTMTDTLTFDGNTEGKDVWESAFNGYKYVHISDACVNFSDLLGGTYTIQDIDYETGEYMEGSSYEVEINEDVSYSDFSEMAGFTCYMLQNNYDDIVVSAQDVYNNGELYVKKGISFFYSPVDDGCCVSKLKAPSAVLNSSPIIHKLDNGYLDLEWLPTMKEKLIAPEQVVTGAYGANSRFTDVHPTVAGTKLAVYFDGVRYVTEVRKFGDGIDGYIYAGNLSIFVPYEANTGEPFCLLIQGVGTTVLCQETGEYLVSLYVLEPNKLPEEFMPESIDGVIIRSSTEGSTKKFKLTVDDSGTITATEVV